MHVLTIDWDSPGEYGKLLEEAVRVLRKGGVVMHPTETCYGLAADIFNEKALVKLYALKKMERDKPVSIMVGSLQEAKKYADFERGLGGENQKITEVLDGAGITPVFLADKFWPGPLTFILPRRDTLPVFLNEGIESVGIRCPDNSLSLAMLEAFGGPLTTTSANLTRWPEVYDVETYLNQLMDEPLRPDLILDAGVIPKKRPSTIIRFKGKDLELIREGEIWPYVKALM